MKNFPLYLGKEFYDFMTETHKSLCIVYINRPRHINQKPKKKKL